MSLLTMTPAGTPTGDGDSAEATFQFDVGLQANDLQQST